MNRCDLKCIQTIPVILSVSTFGDGILFAKYLPVGRREIGTV
jgi:hypothetical protein